MILLYMSCNIHTYHCDMLNMVNGLLVSPLLYMCFYGLLTSDFFIPTVTECVIDGVTYNVGDDIPNNDPCETW